MRSLFLVVCTALLVTPVSAQQPVPQLKKATPAATAAPAGAWKPKVSPASKGLAGATRCEQTGKVVTCDNGYTMTVR